MVEGEIKVELLKTISIGEIIVGAGTLLLAFITFIVTAWQIRESRRTRSEEIARTYKRELLKEVENWVQEVVKALNKDAYDAKHWYQHGKEQDYFDAKAKLLDKLLNLSDRGWFLGQKGSISLEQYGFEKEFDELFENYGACTDELHEVVNPKSTIKEQDEELDSENELLNKVNDFHKLIVEIKGKEQI
jgi:hypothetical protein